MLIRGRVRNAMRTTRAGCVPAYLAAPERPQDDMRGGATADGRTGSGAGIGLGGILVIAGIVVAIVWSLWLGILIAVVGLVAFGGFARGRWY